MHDVIGMLRHVSVNEKPECSFTVATNRLFSATMRWAGTSLDLFKIKKQKKLLK